MLLDDITIHDGDLVMIRLPNSDLAGGQNRYPVWVRVKFADTDGTFIGEVEKKDRLSTLRLGEQQSWHNSLIYAKYKNGDQFCYSDGVTVCECKGLCRNK